MGFGIWVQGKLQQVKQYSVFSKASQWQSEWQQPQILPCSVTHGKSAMGRILMPQVDLSSYRWGQCRWQLLELTWLHCVCVTSLSALCQDTVMPSPPAYSALSMVITTGQLLPLVTVSKRCTLMVQWVMWVCQRNPTHKTLDSWDQKQWQNRRLYTVICQQSACSVRLAWGQQLVERMWYPWGA